MLRFRHPLICFTAAMATATAQDVERLATFEGGKSVSDALFLDAHRVLTAGADGAVRFWNVPRAADDATADDEQPANQPVRVLQAQNSLIYALAVSSDGRWLATSGLKGMVHLRDLKEADSAPPTRSFDTEFLAARDLAFSPDGRWLVFSAEGGKVRRFDLVAQEEAPALAHDGDAVIKTVAFSRGDPLLLASGDTNRLVRIWNPAEGEVTRDLNGHRGHLSELVFSADGSLLASSGWDNTIRLWIPATGEQTAKVSDPRGEGTAKLANIGALDFSPDGTRLASGGNDHFLRIWSVPGLEEQLAWQAHEASIGVVAFSPDGSILASGGDDGKLVLWKILSE